MSPMPALIDDEPVLVGRLISRARRGCDERELALSVWCPWSHRAYTVPWSDASGRTNVVEHVKAPCERGPLVGRTIGVAIDPGAAESAWEVASRHRDARRNNRLALA